MLRRRQAGRKYAFVHADDAETLLTEDLYVAFHVPLTLASECAGGDLLFEEFAVDALSPSDCLLVC